VTCRLTTASPTTWRKIRAYADANRDDPWIVGGGWSMAAFPGGLPRRERLDEVVPDRPVFLPNRDHHGAWVNSRALDLAGIDATTPDPADGRIERDPDGSPTGVLHEGAKALVQDLLPVATLDDQIEALLLAQAYLHSLGITAWQDAILGTYSNIRDASAAYVACAADGRAHGEGRRGALVETGPGCRPDRRPGGPARALPPSTGSGPGR